ncbi:phosphatidate cytidylyltransferase [Pasteurellaceae bacterium RH1A]|nr:phosphatidate cytidylyltransferase [Pasteurellaceae bacterium RH1A]
MTVSHIFISFFAILIVASLIGYLLKQRKGNTSVIENLNARIYAWWIMLFVLLFASVFGSTGTIILYFLISFAGLREFMTLVYHDRHDYKALVVCFYFLLPLQYYFVYTEWYGMFSIFIPVYGFLLLPIVASLSGKTQDFLERAAKIQWAVMISIFCISHVPALLTLNVEGFDKAQNIQLLIFLVAIVQVSDVLQYIWGKLLGKRKIMPSLSPSKTVAGTVGGIASATLIAVLLAPITPFTALQAGLIGFVICLMGFFGGLVMSAIKRDYGVKDWGRMIKGHGGMLDRVDSICFSAPIFFHIVRYFWA